MLEPAARKGIGIGQVLQEVFAEVPVETTQIDFWVDLLAKTRRGVEGLATDYTGGSMILSLLHAFCFRSSQPVTSNQNLLALKLVLSPASTMIEKVQVLEPGRIGFHPVVMPSHEEALTLPQPASSPKKRMSVIPAIPGALGILPPSPSSPKRETGQRQKTLASVEIARTLSSMASVASPPLAAAKESPTAASVAAIATNIAPTSAPTAANAANSLPKGPHEGQGAGWEAPTCVQTDPGRTGRASREASLADTCFSGTAELMPAEMVSASGPAQEGATACANFKALQESLAPLRKQVPPDEFQVSGRRTLTLALAS